MGCDSSRLKQATSGKGQGKDLPGENPESEKVKENGISEENTY